MTIALVSLLVLLFMGMPVVFVLGLSATFALLAADVPLTIVSQRMFAGLNSFTIMAIPFFVFVGVIMDAGGVSRRIVDFATALIGWITGSLLMVSVVAATGLAAISGSGSADTAAISSIMQPALKRKRYDVDFGAALIACSGSLAQIIPPSLMMVVFAVIANVSTGALFLAGIIPGLMTTGTLLIAAYIFARRGGPQYAEAEPFTFGRLLRTGWVALPAFGMPFLIIGGIIGGVFTPTEAAAVAGFYGVIISFLFYRELRVRDLPSMVLKTASLSAAVMLIAATASVFGWIMANADVPDKIAALMLSLSSEAWVFLLTVNVMFLIIGMFMESMAAILIVVPILVPIAASFGVNPVHFGLVVVMNLAVGMVTPPYGISLFVAASVAERNILHVSRKLFLPWLAMMTILLLVTFIPALSLFLPRWAGLIE